MKPTLFLILTLALTGCTSLRVTGEVRTRYGSVASDGKTVRVIADFRDGKTSF